MYLRCFNLNIYVFFLQSYRLRTRTVNKTVNPEFNETLTFYGITDDDIITQSLHILILGTLNVLLFVIFLGCILESGLIFICLNIDDDKYGHDFLGEAKFPLHRLKPGVMRDLCLNLEKHIPVH